METSLRRDRRLTASTKSCLPRGFKTVGVRSIVVNVTETLS
jgi:hypothetical protein